MMLLKYFYMETWALQKVKGFPNFKMDLKLEPSTDCTQDFYFVYCASETLPQKFHGE